MALADMTEDQRIELAGSIQDEASRQIQKALSEINADLGYCACRLSSTPVVDLMGVK